MHTAALLVLLLQFARNGGVLASKGDVQHIFRVCTRLCTDACAAYPDNNLETKQMMVVLDGYAGDGRIIPDTVGRFTPWQRFMLWDCPDECKYYCMWVSEDHWTNISELFILCFPFPLTFI